MPTVACEVCQTSFRVKTSHIERGWGRYCSKRCQYLGQRRGVTQVCTYCGKDVYKPRGELPKSSSGLYFCDKSCRCAWANTQRAGAKHPNWKGGDKVYRATMLCSGEALACRLCGLTDERVLVVHHLDEDRSNNSLDNLIWLCCNCHYLVHHHEEERAALTEALTDRSRPHAETTAAAMR